jgi:ubiquinone/menaquinone biosynthesis C-methylase UbiE
MAGDSTFAGSIPEIYDRYLVPLIFEPYALDLARRLSAFGPADILEVAAGTGVVTRAMAALMPDARIVASDLNQPMLDRAARMMGPGANVTWRQADALALPFDDGSFDTVVCQFGAMFFPDKVRAYREARRVLRPGGRFVFNVWDAISRNEFADAVTKTLTDMFPDDPPLFMARTPHGYHDPAAIRAQLNEAGFSVIDIDTVEERSRAPLPRDVAIAYCQGTPLRNEIEARRSDGLEEATSAASAELARRFGDGPIEGRICAHVIRAC